MKNIILHIPHNSTFIPYTSINQYVNVDLLINNINELTDFYTKELFGDEYESIVFEYNRFYCDVERYIDNNLEPMFKKGMGVIYNKGVINQEIIRRELTPTEIEEIYKIYNQHHKLVMDKLLTTHNPILVDCHSFSNKIYDNGTTNSFELPDFCIGFNNDNTYDGEIVDRVINYLEDLGYIVGINNPYSGSLSYNGIKMKSLMIEVNKKIYLDENNKLKSDFYKIKNVISGCLKLIGN